MFAMYVKRLKAPINSQKFIEKVRQLVRINPETKTKTSLRRNDHCSQAFFSFFFEF